MTQGQLECQASSLFVYRVYSRTAFLKGVCATCADAVYNLNGFTKADGIFGVFNALGTVAFAYGGHNVILEIQVCQQPDVAAEHALFCLETDV